MVIAVDVPCPTESTLQVSGEAFPLSGHTHPYHTASRERTDTNSSVGIVLLPQIFIPEPWFSVSQKDEASFGAYFKPVPPLSVWQSSMTHLV